ncbi:chemotaxis response regulator protein-glutamate methylesterase [Planctomycetota bacterium]|nr:chemotaxis response regulator protein-glutamate methylesterase [Planctomycetota bacterium]
MLVVDDSATVRRVLSEGLNRTGDIRVVGVAPDPYVARERIVELNPDVITLDVEMPRMDGISFLAKLMQHRPMPVVVISSLTPAGSEEAMRAFQLGAVDVLCKPGSAYDVGDAVPRLARAIRAAAAARCRGPRRLPLPAVTKPALAIPTPAASSLHRTSDKVLALGASTGGTEALREVLADLPGDTPGTVIVQHMPPMFTASFAQSLNRTSRLQVSEAKGGEPLLPGLAYVAPGGYHLVVVRTGAHYQVELRDGPEVHFQRPAVDVTFLSVAKSAGANAVGVLLTGMGSDGAAGLKAMRAAGAHTIAQDEASCVVFGMPKAAIDLGAAAEIVPLSLIAGRISQALRRIAV